MIFAVSASRADSVDAYIRQQLRLRHIPGLSLAVVRDGKIVKSAGYGLANVELKTPATAETVYQLASLTKQFTATAILLLVQDNKIGLDDPIRRYVDNTPETWNGITLRHLLTHTSGLKDYLEETEDIREDMTPDKLVQSITEAPLLFAPGEKYRYSNTNYLLLSLVVRRVTGVPFDRFLAERVFQPLGMHATRLTRQDDLIPHRAAGYTWDKERRTWRNASPLNPTVWDNGDGGIVSSVLDLAKWDAALYSDSILTAASRASMGTAMRFNNGTTGSYGFGWNIGERQGHRFLEHNGGRPGTSTAMLRFIDDKLTVIVLTNQDYSRAQEIADRVATFYLSDLAPPMYRPVRHDLDPKKRERIRFLMEGFAAARPLGEFLPPGLPTGISMFPEPIKNSAGLAENLHRLGKVRSVVLVEREPDGDTMRLRYRVTYPQDRLLVTSWWDKTDRLTRLDFRIEDR
jgi:CubicO group peptidase (beta-lactamase class C family)